MTIFGQDGCNRVNEEQKRRGGFLSDSQVKPNRSECPKKLPKWDRSENTGSQQLQFEYAGQQGPGV